MSYANLRFESKDRVACVTLHRPERGNALNLEMVREMSDLVARIGDEGGARAVLLRGTGQNFCVGGDVKAFAERGADLAGYLRQVATELHVAVSRLARLDLPVVAAVQGAAAGAGMSLACGADFVIAADSARFTMAYTKIGLSVDGGSSYYLSRIVGMRRALELMLTNRVLPAAEAHAWGLVTRVVAPTSLDAEAEGFASTLASAATRALGAAKRLLREGWSESLETQLESETTGIVDTGRSADAREGITAFVERRAPRFRGE
jgi:2-(1,2-epoxy-1,2-dihydrophenyl)acetyl-CoA isomerase